MTLAVKKRASKARLTEIARKIDVQRRRAARPTLPVNTHAPVSKSMAEKRKSLARKARQRKAWDEE
jgi:hypothetical protein